MRWRTASRIVRMRYFRLNGGSPPFVNEYGCLHTSHVFFLLCASHVVRLNENMRKAPEDCEQWSRELTSPGGCSEWYPSIYTGRIAAGRVLLVHCIFCMYLSNNTKTITSE